ncbi:hypothetical protein LCGC14_0736450 [marine sediment metagenome]|uniref:Uncharacterized protein n=1 Tax=marine sediment metagenome TaxID=412755 RepID=A0A0F9QSY1_9ZZZZ
MSEQAATGEPVTFDQQLLAARCLALANLEKAEARILHLAGWPGPDKFGQWRDPMSGIYGDPPECLAKIRNEIKAWAPPEGERIV